MNQLDNLIDQLERHFAVRGFEFQRHPDGRLTSRMEIDGIVGRLEFTKQSFGDDQHVCCVLALQPGPIPDELDDEVDELTERLGDGIGFDPRTKAIYGVTFIDVSIEIITDAMFDQVLATLVNNAGRMLVKVRPVLDREMSPAAAAAIVLIDVPIDARVLPATP